MSTNNTGTDDLLKEAQDYKDNNKGKIHKKGVDCGSLYDGEVCFCNHQFIQHFYCKKTG